MKRYNVYFLSTLFLILFGACSDSDPVVPEPTPPTPTPELKDGINTDPASPDADQTLTITFKAASSSELYNYTGDVYMHTGVVDEGTWLYVPAEWDENISKCKMTKVEDNVWSITLSPSVRQWYNSAETPVQKLGVVIRSSDGTKKGLANDAFITVTDTKYTGFAPAAIKESPLPTGVQEGINVIDNSTVTLVLYDKDTAGKHKDFAHVVGDFNQWKLTNEANCQMFRDNASGCWWITLTGLNAAKEYAFQYYVGTKGGETTRLGDAYCEKILDPDNDAKIPGSTYTDNKTYPTGGKGIVSVFKIQKDNYAWKVNDFKMQKADKLVIYEMLFRDFTSTGDINGATQKLNYLKSLGVNAIELMPVQEFDGNDSWGYNPCYYFAFDKAYGTKQMYKAFIDACHQAGMAVILDVVYNHATGSMPFAKLYWDSEKNRTASNNPYFNVEAPHPYNVFHDFNHESSLVRKFVKRNLKFLLEEYKLDGFRFDLTKGFTQKKSTESTASNYDATRIAILKDYNAAIKEVNPNAYVVLEHFCDNTEERELAADGMCLWRKMSEAYYQSAMGWSEKSSFSGLYESTFNWVGYMESHDEERTAFKQSMYGNGSLKTNLADRMSQLSANAAFFFTVPGPKMVWQFGEMGYDISIDVNGRTGKKPLHWEYLENSNRKALHDTYAKLIQLRNEHPGLFASDVAFQWKVSVSDWTGGRFITSSTATENMVVVGNFTSASTEYDVAFPIAGTWYDYLSGEKVEISNTNQKITVPAHTAIVFTTFQ